MNERIETVRAMLGELGCDAYASVFPPTNQRLSGFLTSFEEISSGIVITRDEAHFLCDSRYTEQAHDQVAGFEITEIAGDLLDRCAERLEKLGAKKAAFNPAGITFKEYETLRKGFAGKVEATEAIDLELRIRKDPQEIECIRAASELAEGVLADLLPTLSEGDRERELAARFEYEFKKRGASAASFGTIALFGARSSLPHGEPGEKGLEQGDTILLDFGCRMGGYCSDLTRTYAFGTIPGAWFDEIYDLTLTAQKIALEAVRPGAKCSEVDAVARNLISEGGFGQYFGHGLGHGVGIEIHEAPRLNPFSDFVLEEGMVVTIEPGIYLPGKGGVRIEDLVVVTHDGSEVLTSAPKELKVLQG